MYIDFPWKFSNRGLFTKHPLFKSQTQFKDFLASVCGDPTGQTTALLRLVWIICRQFLFHGRDIQRALSVYKTPLQRFDVKQLSKSNKNKITHQLIQQHQDQRTKNIFLYKKHQKQSHIKNGNYQFKCAQRYENDPHSGKKCCKRFKNSDAGFVFWSRKSKSFFGQTSAEKHPKNHNLQYLE